MGLVLKQHIVLQIDVLYLDECLKNPLPEVLVGAF